VLDQVRPALTPTAEVRRRSDGTEGVYDPATGHWFETTPEQANLIGLFDGKRSLLEISAEYLGKFGFVPFAALDDLMRGLVDNELLIDGPRMRGSGPERSPWVDAILPSAHARWKDLMPRPVRMLELVLWPAMAMAVWVMIPQNPLGAIDVPLAYAGAVLALTLRARLKAAVCAMFKFPPRRTLLASAAWVFHVVPDPAIVVLLDKRQRILAHLGAIAGLVCALAICSPWPGAWAGALVVTVLDLCPVFASSASGVLTALSGEANFKERLRAYVGLPLFKKLFSGKLLKSDTVFVVSAVLSMVWVVVVLYLVLGPGLASSRALIEVGVHEAGYSKWVAWVGAVFVMSVSPLPLIVIVNQFIDAAFLVFWPPNELAKKTRGKVELKLFRAIPLFSRLSDDELSAIAGHAKVVAYNAGDVLVEEGAQGKTFFSVLHGVVEVTRGDPNVRAKVVARLGPGDCFGETAMLQDGVRTASVRATSPVEVIELPSAAFEQVVATVGGVDFASVLRAAGAIGKSKLFKEMPADRLSSLATKFVPRSVPAGTDVVKFGEQGTEFYLIAKGQVEVLSGEGKRLVQLGDGDHFGEIALLRNVPRTATVRTLTDTLLLVLGRDVFMQALQADLSLSERAEQSARSRAASDAAPGAAPSAGS
jgi:cAMP-dependent protein kinase regulator